jgi:hypothetical protein
MLDGIKYSSAKNIQITIIPRQERAFWQTKPDPGADPAAAVFKGKST